MQALARARNGASISSEYSRTYPRSVGDPTTGSLRLPSEGDDVAVESESESEEMLLQLLDVIAACTLVRGQLSNNVRKEVL